MASRDVTTGLALRIIRDVTGSLTAKTKVTNGTVVSTSFEHVQKTHTHTHIQKHMHSQTYHANQSLIRKV